MPSVGDGLLGYGADAWGSDPYGSPAEGEKPQRIGDGADVIVFDPQDYIDRGLPIE